MRGVDLFQNSPVVIMERRRIDPKHCRSNDNGEGAEYHILYPEDFFYIIN